VKSGDLLQRSGRKKSSRPIWERKSLADMNPHEWEQLCDGCGKCCCYRGGVSDGDGRYACPLLDTETSQCSDYRRRKQHVPDCFQITAKNIHSAVWLPSSCAYRLLAQGKPLPRWHHLVSGSRLTVHEAGRSVRGKIISSGEHDTTDPA
jgi:hypothetical protein